MESDLNIFISSLLKEFFAISLRGSRLKEQVISFSGVRGGYRNWGAGFLEFAKANIVAIRVHWPRRSLKTLLVGHERVGTWMPPLTDVSSLWHMLDEGTLWLGAKFFLHFQFAYSFLVLALQDPEKNIIRRAGKKEEERRDEKPLTIRSTLSSPVAGPHKKA